MKKAKKILQHRKNKRAVEAFEKTLNKIPIAFIPTPHTNRVFVNGRAYNVIS